MKGYAVLSVAAALVAGPAMACTLIVERRPDGSLETPEELHRRVELNKQREAWRNADYVFLARVRSQRFVTDQRIDIGLDPNGAIKGGGSLAPRFGKFDPDSGNTCGPYFHYPDVGRYGVFYARRAQGWRRWLPWTRMEITFAVPIGSVYDPRIPIEMRAAAARLRKSRIQ